ncbi:ankyrin repeat domain-containing protein [Helicobacter zhangjianzhongii]|uniref:ankyrin repeat domain-containing protein n=1 Tax=Helicobacter zhangjianzhongii TaxID=2974574 RepID=UPI002557BAF0|nr:ankyrin repeat domain-containing protein [Helicobacter sp. CPD2-1]MDL0079182.1 ankyrin repeat domain-containing protein [Helicobacter sp. CPD2-1]
MLRLITLFAISFALCLGQVLESSATAPTQEEAKSAALDELSQSIEVSVRAKHSIIQAQSQEQSYEEVISHITLESSSQFIQPKITYKKLKKNLYEAAILIDDPAPYHAALKKLSAEIDALSIGVETPITQRDLKERIYKLENIIGLYKTYRAYELVLLAMGEPIRSAPKQNLAYFAAKYSSIDPKMFERRADSSPTQASSKDIATSRSYHYSRGYNSSQALFEAIRAGNSDGVYSALKDGINPNIMDDFGTPALILGLTNPDITTLLLEFGANPEEVDNEGRTPLIAATDPRISNKTCRSIQALLEYKANPNHTIAYDGSTQIPLVQMYNNYNEMGFVGEFWEKQGIYECNKRELVKLYLQKGADINLRDDSGRGILYFAAMSGDIELVRLLLDSGAKIDPSIDRGNTNTTAGKSIQALLDSRASAQR